MPLVNKSSSVMLPTASKESFVNVAWGGYAEQASVVVEAAYAVLLASLTGNDDVTFKCIYSGAERIARVNVSTQSCLDGVIAQLMQKDLAADDVVNGPKFTLLTHDTEETFTDHSNPREMDHALDLALKCCIHKNGVSYCLVGPYLARERIAADRLVRQFSIIVQRIVASSPGVAMRELNAVGDIDLSEIWHHNTKVPNAMETSVHDLVTKSAIRCPDSPAICAWDGDLTYGQLETMSTGLAQYLIELDLGSNAVVPLCFEKSKWTMVAMLGVLKAGATFTMLPSSGAVVTLNSIVQRVGANTVFCSSAQRPRLEHLSGVVVLDTMEEQLLRTNTKSILPKIDSSATSTILFTSGSTGVPKGITLSHKCMSTVARNLADRFDITARSRVFQFTAYQFDVSIHETFAALTSGGTVCVPSEDARLTQPGTAINDFGADWVCMTPSALREALQDHLPSLRTLVVAGEKLEVDHLPPWTDRLTVHNWYGPAEFPLATSAVVQRTKDCSGLIGRAFAGVCWVTNPNDCDVLSPFGCIGELLVEGPSMAEGYLKDVTLTAASFVENPSWLLRGTPGNHSGRKGRVYRTGDLVRYREDGSLQYIGRKDAQVKIRGQRVELGEVEHHVKMHLPGTHLVAEVTTPRDSKRPTLVMFVVPPGSTKLTEDQRREWVRRATGGIYEKLEEDIPAYMIPSGYIAIAAVPITATGKTDRHKLREVGASLTLEEIGGGNQSDTTTVVEPTGPVECILRDVWAKVLNLSDTSISVDTPFARLGGDSITAMQVLSRCRAQSLGVTMSNIMRLQTIRRIAAQCTLAPDVGEVSHVEENDDAGGASWPLSPIQQMFIKGNPEQHHHYNQSFILRTRKAASLETLRQAVQSVVKRHAMLRARFRRRADNEWEQFILRFDSASVTFEAHVGLSRADVERQVQSRQESLDIVGGPIFATDVFNDDAEGQLVLLSAHHIIVDLVSWRVIWHDLQESLEGKTLGQPTMSFRKWCQLQYREAQSLEPSAVLPFPIAHPRFDYWGVQPRDNITRHSRMFYSRLDAEASTLLTGESNEALRSEPIDIIVAALDQSFAHLFPDRSPPAMFVEGHGREKIDGLYPDVSETVGWFTTCYPIQVGSKSCADPMTAAIAAVGAAKDRRHAVPEKGRPYFASRYNSERGGQTFGESHGLEVLLNYTGRFQQLESTSSLLTHLKEPVNVKEIGPGFHRFALVEIEIGIKHGELEISFEVNTHMKHQNRLQLWIDNFTESLTQWVRLLKDCPLRLTSSDNPLLPMSNSSLEKFADKQLHDIGIRVEDVLEAYPCSPMQEGLLMSRSRGSASYATYWTWACSIRDAGSGKTSVSMTRLEQAWEDAINRHSVFQTIFSEHPETGVPIQVLLKPAKARLRRVESGCDSPDVHIQTLEVPSFHSSEPEYQVTLCHNTHGQLACRLDMSHALIDATSVIVLIRDVVSAYMGNTLPAPPQFREAITHMRTYPSPAEKLQYWQKVLTTARPCHFPTLQGDRPVQGKTHGLLPVRVHDPEAISEFCKLTEITPSVFLQVAWALVLSRWVGLDKPCFGYLASGRDMPLSGIHDMVAVLINMLVGYVDLTQPIDQVWESTSRSTIDNLGYQHTSLAEIEHSLKIKGQEVQRLFNTSLTIQRSDPADSCSGGLHFEEQAGDDPHEFDLTLDVLLSGSKATMNLGFRHNTIGKAGANQVVASMESAMAFLLRNRNSDNRTGANVCDEFFRFEVGTSQSATNEYWQKQLEGSEPASFPPLPAPTYVPNVDAVTESRTEVLPVTGDGVSLKAILRASWAILQAEYVTGSEIVFGSAVGSDQMVSRRAESVPLRMSLDRDTTIGQLLHRTQEQAETMDEFKHSGLPFIRRVSHEAELCCGFQSILVEHIGSPGLGALDPESFDDAVHSSDGFEDVSSHALVLHCRHEQTEIHMQIAFDSAVLDRTQANRIVNQFGHILRNLRVQSGTRLRDLDIMGKQDLNDIWRWNATDYDPVDACVHDMLAETIDRQPKAPAVHAWDGEFNYGELDRLSTRLAFLLSNAGVKPGVIVPLHFEKSKWIVVAILGVMKAGGASVVLDATLPQSRLRTIAQQVNAQIVVCSAESQHQAAQLCECQVIVADSALVSQPAPSSLDFHPARTTSSDWLYVVFTSGSTGVPKGAVITHGNFSSAFVHQAHPLGFRNNSRVFDFVSYAFDVVWSNVLHTLFVGGCICIPNEQDRRNNVTKAMCDLEVNFADFTPTVARLLNPSEVPQLQTLLLSGEAVKSADAKQWRSVATLINTYGPAETTVKTTVDNIQPDRKGDPSIGKGIGGNTWLVDPSDYKRLVPIGCIGELLFDGPLVIEGYLHNVEKTNAAFVEDPPWLLRGSPGTPGRRGRLYLTGDLVRYRSDGSLDFVGRKDDQVKIRGQRVELGEVEFHIRQLLSASEGGDGSARADIVAEIVKPQGSDRPALVAFVVASRAPEMTEDERKTTVQKMTHHLSKELASLVPESMIPSGYIALPTLPMTPTGKTDRRKLREHGATLSLKQISATDGTDTLIHPTSPIESTLRKVWAGVLNTLAEHISVETPFTRLGGDSISAMQVMSRCRAQGIGVTMADILRLQTIRKVAARCQTSVASAAQTDERYTENEEPWPLSPIQQRFLDNNPESSIHNHYNLSSMLRVTTPTPIATLREAVFAVVKRHSMLRARFRQRTGMDREWEQYITPFDPSSVILDTHVALSPSEVRERAERRQKALDIQSGPVFAVDVFENCGEERQVILLTAHHIIIDLVSWRIIYHDFQESLEGRSIGQPTLPFRQWCSLQETEARNIDPAATMPGQIATERPQYEYWGVEPKDNTFQYNKILSATLDATTTDLLTGLSNDALKTEPVDVIIAALDCSFRKIFKDRKSPTMYVEGHGRENIGESQPDVSETVGWFTTYYPLPLPTLENDAISDVIKNAKDRRRAMPSKGRKCFACGHYNESERSKVSHSGMEVLVNYTGRFQQLEDTSARLTALENPIRLTETSPRLFRFALVEIDIVITGGQLEVAFNISTQMRQQADLERWTQLFPQVLHDAVMELSTTCPTLSASDVPLLSISNSALASFVQNDLPKSGVPFESVVDIYPCSPLQEGLWLSMSKEDASYKSSWIWECSVQTMDGATPAFPAQLERAWMAVIARHSVFSTILAEHPETGRPVQVLLKPSTTPRIRLLDSSSIAPTEIAEDLFAPTFAPNEPGFLVTICHRYATGEQVACRLDMNHSLIDATSMTALTRDLTVAYNQGELGPVPQFRDAIEVIEKMPRAEKLEYWRTFLADVTPCHFPTTRRVLSEHQKSHAILPLDISEPSRIQDFCKTHEITRSVFFQVVWSLVLAQWTGAIRPCFGYLASGRDMPIDNIHDMVAPLVNLLVSCTDLSKGIDEVLRATNQSTIESTTHQHTALADVEHELGTHDQRLFNTSLVLQSTSSDIERPGGLQLTQKSSDDPHEWDLTLDVYLDGSNTTVDLDFRQDRIADSIVRQVADSVKAAIDFVVQAEKGDTDQPCGSTYAAFSKHETGVCEETALAFWKEELGGAEAVHFPQPSTPWCSPRVGESLSCCVKDFPLHPDDHTTTTIVLAAWSLLQMAYTNTTESIFGAALPSQGPATSLFALAPVRIMAHDQITVEELLQQVQTHLAASTPYCQTGLHRIRRIGEDIEQACQFQSVVMAVEELCALDVEQIEKSLFDTYPLVLHCAPEQDQLGIRISFDSTILNHNQARGVLNQFRHVISQLCTPCNRDIQIRDLHTTSDEDLCDIWSWNARRYEPVESCVHDLIAETAQRHPTAPAICAWDGDFTYAQLDALSTQLAYRLVNLGVKRGDFVPVCFEKSKWQPISLLAVMKAGGASVALDITLPEARLSQIAQQVGARIIVSSAANQHMAERLCSCAVTIVGTSLLSAQHTSPRLGMPKITPADWLYIVFTSGSTGTPKGTIVTHANFSSAFAYLEDALHFKSTSRVFDFVSYAFDVGWSNFLYTLHAGGCLCIPSEDDRKGDIAYAIRSLRANFADLTPTVARLLDPSEVPDLQTIVLSGETVNATDTTQWKSIDALVNTYGPAESTVKTTLALLSPEVAPSIGIGTGANTWVVDQQDETRLAPIGSIGELWLESPLVGAGYLNDESKTSAAFVRDPPWLIRGSNSHPGRHGRLYRTGDLVRYRGDGTGTLDFIGRRDAQVKIHGQRVELGEIEHHILSQLAPPVTGYNPQVMAEVIQSEDRDGETLLAFIISPALTAMGEKEQMEFISESTSGIDERLARILPGYMIPSRYVLLGQLPMTASGKADRRQLRQIGALHMAKQQQDVRCVRSVGSPAETEAERQMQMLWASTLKVDIENINTSDSFVRMGGDSITAMRLVAAARKQGYSLRVGEVLLHPRLADMARFMVQDSGLQISAQTIPPFSLIATGVEESWLRKQAATQCSVRPDDIADVFPCTPLQEGLMALTARNSRDYITTTVFDLEPGADLDSFRSAWKRLVESFSILRTRLVDIQGCGLVQAVVKHSIPLLDGPLAEAKGSDLGTPLCRAVLEEAKDTSRSSFVLEMHHALYDGWSMQMLLKYLQGAYHGAVVEAPVPLQSFVRHIRDMDLTAAESFWRKQLGGSAATQFPVLPTPAHHSRTNAVAEHRVDGLTWSAYGVTGATAVRAAWALLQARYTASDDVIFGAVMSGRQAPIAGIERIAGPTIATVPIRIVVPEDATVEQLLSQVQAQAAEMIGHEQMGLQRIRRLDDEADQSCGFQTLLVVQHEQVDHSQTSLLRERIDSVRQNDRDAFEAYALVVRCELEKDGLAIKVNYDSAVLTQEEVQRILHQLDHILTNILSLDTRQANASTLQLASPQDLQDIWSWNMSLPTTVSECVHELVGPTILKRSQDDALAVSAWDGELTYSQLDSLSTQLAGHLTAYGVGPEVVVPLCIEKSVWMPVAALGVMKAGGASVMLDVNQPQDRLRTIIQQIQPLIAISSPSSQALMACLAPDCLVIPASPCESQPRARCHLPTPVQPHNTMCVLFTSGSTGTPKGVQLTHQNFSSALALHAETLQLHNQSRIYDFTSYSFDFAWSNLLLTLYTGGCLCIPSEAERKADVVGSLIKHRATFAFFTPSLLRTLDLSTATSLQSLMIGGEGYRIDDFEEFLNYRSMTSVYGPTECTVFIAAVSLNDRISRTPGVLGRPTGMCGWIVDVNDTSQLSPVGAIGELCVEGPLVGAGYFKEKDKTAAAFFDDPPWLLQGPVSHPEHGRHGRLYRTGDLVRYREDGILQIIGRKDVQVKIRGQRVELSEVEYHIKASLPPFSASAEVVADVITPQGSCRPTLVAFVVPPNSASMTETQLSDFVREFTSIVNPKMAETVPVYMIPTAYIAIATIPRTASGKIDRRQLRQLGAAMTLEALNPPSRVDEHHEPKDQSEHILREVWADVLNIPAPSISVDVAFARLGGDSITAMQVASRLRGQGRQIAVAEILRLQTIRALAPRLSSLEPSSATTQDFDTSAASKEWPLSPIQQLFLDANPVHYNHFNQSFLFSLAADTSLAMVKSATEAIVKRHGMLRARFNRDTGGTWRQQVERFGPESVTFEVHTVGDDDEIESKTQHRQSTLDIQNGPVFAVDVFLSDKRSAILLSAHHLVIDLVSWRIIWHDMQELMRGRSLHPPTTSFQTWCDLQESGSQAASSGQALSASSRPIDYDYWGIEPQENHNGSVDAFTACVGAQTTAILLGKGNDAFRTEPTDIIVAALATAFRTAFPDRETAVIHMEGHGREPMAGAVTDVSETVGWFTEFRPVQLPSAADRSLTDAIACAKDARRQLPDSGRSYLARQYHQAAEEAEHAGPGPVEILVNYTGRFQQLEDERSMFTAFDRSWTLHESDPNTQRFALVDVAINVIRGEMEIEVAFNTRMKHQQRLRAWLQASVAELQHAAHSLVHSPPSLTTSDLPLLQISHSALRSFVDTNLGGMGVEESHVMDIYPCSPLQEGVQLSKKRNTASYANFWIWDCTTGAADAQQPVSPERLVQAWHLTINRHSIFATIFSDNVEDGRAVQVLLSPSTQPQVHLVHVSAVTATQAASAFTTPALRQNRPEYAVHIFQADDGSTACRMDVSHALVDAASMPILIRDVQTAYNSGLLPPAPPFRSAIECIAKIPEAQRIQYWTSFLTDVRPCNYPTRSQKGHSSTAVSHGHLQVNAGSATEVYDFCKAKGITRSNLLQIAWAMAISRCLGIDEACFGYLGSGRDMPIEDVDEIVGPLINIRIARIDLKLGVAEVLDRVRRHTIEHFEYQHVSLADIEHNLALDGRRLFNTAVTVRDGYQVQPPSSGLRLRETDSADPHEFDLLLNTTFDGSKTDIEVAFRHATIAEAAAREIKVMVEAAIHLLLQEGRESHNAPQSSPLGHRFYMHTTGVDEEAASCYWQKQLANPAAWQFPALPSPTHVPKVDSKTELTKLDGLDPSACGVSGIAATRAIWALLQARYTASDEVIFGTLVDAPGASSTRVATVPVRLFVPGERTVQSLLADVQDQTTAMSGYDRVGLQRIRLLGEDAEECCSFQTLLDCRMPSSPAVHESPEPAEEYAMVVRCMLDEGTTHVQIEYDSTVLEAGEASRILHQFAFLLTKVLSMDMTARAKKIAELEVTSHQEIQQIWSWNANPPATIIQCMHDFVATTMHKHQDALAVCAWDGQWTYAELDDLSTRLAHHLVVNLGIGQEDVVPLCIEKSKWMPIAILGVMKAGGASVMIEVTQPEERLRSVVEKVQPVVMISTNASDKLANRLAVDCPGLHICSLDDMALERVDGWVSPDIPPSSTLCLVFTSGSTGTPKGARLTHQNFSSALGRQAEALGISSTSRVYDFTSYSFDVAWANFLLSLYAGACLCVPSEAERKGDVAASIARFGATFAFLTPSLAHTLDLSATEMDTLVLAGEKLRTDDIDRLLRNHRTMSIYGPAECTVMASLVDLATPGARRAGALGRPLATCIWITEADSCSQLCPVGAVGELCIEGPLVGGGYLNDHEKTAAAFIDSPPWLKQGSSSHRGREGRVYRTGDLARYRTDGSLEIVGRKDAQVKIHGQRLELGEVEYNVKQHFDLLPGGSQVVVEMVTLRNTERASLVAFVILPQSDARTGEERADLIAEIASNAHDNLAGVIPIYMIPTGYIPLDTLPMTATGKTDRRQLRQLGSSYTLEQAHATSSKSSPKLLPRTDMEKRLRDLWAGVLGVEAEGISVNDSFLQVGGDSIAAMRLVADARKLRLSLTVNDILMRPRLHAMAAAVGKVTLPRPPEVRRMSFVGQEAAEELFLLSSLSTPIDRADVQDIFPTSHMQEQYITGAVDRTPIDTTHVVIDVTGMDVLRLGESCLRLVQHFDILRTVFVRDGPKCWQVIMKNATIRLESIEVEGDVDLAADKVCEEDVGVIKDSPDLRIRFMLLENEDQDLRLVLRISHAFYDGVSMPQILSALASYHKGHAVAKTPPFSRYMQYALSESGSSLAYWRSLLQGSRMSTIPRSAESAEYAMIGHEQTIPLPRCFKDGTFTPATFFDASCAIMLARLTGCNDVVFGHFVSGRSSLPSWLEGVVGPCHNIVPLRVKVDEKTDSTSILDRVHVQHANGTLHEMVGLSKIAAECSSWPEAAPEFGLVSHYQNITVEASRLDLGEECSRPYRFYSSEQPEPRENGVSVRGRPVGDELVLSITAKSNRHDQALLQWIGREVVSVLSTFDQRNN